MSRGVGFLKIFPVKDQTTAELSSPHPLYCLPGGDQPHVLHLRDGVQEQLEALPVVRRGEPGGVVVESEGSPVGVEMPLEVLHDHQVNTLGVPGVTAGICHAAATILMVELSQPGLALSTPNSTNDMVAKMENSFTKIKYT